MGASYGADGTITYNFGAIQDVAQAIGTFEGAMDGSLQDLYQQFQQLFANDWHGQAGAACNEAQHKWNQGCTEIKEALGRVGVALNASAETIHSVDVSVAAGM